MEADHINSERLLVEKAKIDQDAFVELYNFYFPKIYGYIFKRIGQHETSEDLVSSTFMKAFAALPNYQNRNLPFGAWLFKIATNNLYDHYRKKSNKDLSVEDLKMLPAANSLNEEMEKESDRRLIHQIIGQLPPRHQEIIHLKFFAELNNKEIAVILNETPNNVGVLVHRALKQANNLYTKRCGTKKTMKILTF